MNTTKISSARAEARSKFSAGYRPRLLSNGNIKLRKRGTIAEEWFITGLSLAPAKISGYNMCAGSSPECRKFCLFGTGMAPEFMHKQSVGHNSIWATRIVKTLWYMEDRLSFMDRLVLQIGNLAKKHDRLGIRLNVFSDRPWETQQVHVDQIQAKRAGVRPGVYRNLMEVFPQVQFYDYTKILKRLDQWHLPANYHLTFSLCEDNTLDATRALFKGYNVAAVMDEMPDRFLGHRVIDGDEHDLRFLDPTPVVVRLKPKGALARSDSPFVQRIAA